MREFLNRFSGCQSGATSIEYALIAAFIGIALVSAAQAIGLDLVNVFNNVSAAL